MSYILDALKKSESERRQGKVPDLGQQTRFIHKPKKRGFNLGIWVAIALFLNAGVLAYVFWPKTPAESVSAGPSVAEPDVAEPDVAEPDVVDAEIPAPVAVEPAIPAEPTSEPLEKPTVIVPSVAEPSSPQAALSDIDPSMVPHLLEMPVAFQRTIPDLTFNSHIYASRPESRRVMINNQYLRTGERVSGMVVEQITESGVVLSKNGRAFRVGVVRDWVSPN